MKLKKINLIILIFVFLILAVLFSALYKIISGYSVSEEKCAEINTDDCWHSLAHQTFNKSFCYKIKDNELIEHCLKHFD